MEPTFTRVAINGTETTLSLNEAAAQFIRDEGAYMNRSEDEIEELLEDMPAVFETQDILRTLEAGQSTTSGVAAFTRN